MTSRRRFAALLVVAACVPPSDAAPPGARLPFDVLITGATVVDGTGAPGFAGEVALRGDRIVRVSRAPLPRDSAARVIDAAGRVLAPGFIDLHVHLDALLWLPGAENLTRQGVTTAVGGPDGGSPWPLAPFLDSVRSGHKLGINVAFLAGHNTIRERVLGYSGRPPTSDELAHMRHMVAEAMGDGAFGLSTGLKYPPGVFATTDEVVALARVAADSGGIYASHLREEGVGLIEGVAEALEIGRRARVPVVLTHHKAMGPPMWGASARTLAMVDSARDAGTDVMMDQYPYTATFANIGVLFPGWALEDGRRALDRRLRDPVLRDSIRRSVIATLLTDRGGGDLRRVRLVRVLWDRSLEGKTLRDLADARGVDTTVAGGAELVLDIVRRGDASAIFDVLDEADVERIMRHPQTAIASDGALLRLGEGHPHPRWYGTFPRVLGVYVRERRVLTLEDAVRKMTGLPAARLGLADRGRVAEGCVADLVLLDPATVVDRATFPVPHQYPKGIEYVWVSGVPVVERGRFTEARPGRVLRRGNTGS